MRVALIPTGKLEMLGLATGLQSLFGVEHDFTCIPRRRDQPHEPFPGFTSAPLPQTGQREPRSALSNLVAAMVDALWSDGYDLAVVLDDLELFNIDNETVVIEELRAAAMSCTRLPVRTAAITSSNASITASGWPSWM